MEKKDTPFSDKEKHIIARVESTLSSIDENHNVLERKAQHNFVTISAAATAVIALNIAPHLLNLESISSNADLAALQKCALLVFGLSHLGVTLLFLFVHIPRKRAVKFLDPKPGTVEGWLNLDSDSYLTQMLSTYVNLCQKDDKSIPWKGKAVWLSTIATGIGMVAAWAHFLVRFVLAQ